MISQKSLIDKECNRSQAQTQVYHEMTSQHSGSRQQQEQTSIPFLGLTKSAMDEVKPSRDRPSSEEARGALCDTVLSAPTKCQLRHALPGAQRQVLVRRKTARRQSVDLLAELDDLLRCPARHRQIRSLATRSAVAAAAAAAAAASGGGGQLILESAPAQGNSRSVKPIGEPAKARGGGAGRARARNQVLTEAVGLIWRLVADDEVSRAPRGGLVIVEEG